MRSGKSFLGLLIVATALGAYIYFVEMTRDPAADSASTREKVFTLTPGSIESVNLTNASGETTTVVRQEAVWNITAPEAAEADTVEISTVVSSIESLEQTRVVTETPESLAPFGLDPARISVAFTVAGESTPRRLKLGNKTPTGGDLYAQVEGSPKVFLIGGYLEDTFNKGPFALREKSVLKFSRDGADALTITQGTSRLSLAKSGNTWRLSVPIDAAADFNTVDGLIGRIFQARMAGFVAADGTASLREYGLDRPQAIVTVGSGSSRAELAIGSAQDDTNVYARDLSRSMIFTIEKALLDELRKKPEDVRLKDLFNFRSFTATAFEITTGGTKYTFTKTKGEGDNADVWTLTAPTTKAADAAKMTDLLTTSSNLRAASFAAAAFASGDTVTIAATFDDAGTAKTETVTFRKSGAVVHGIRTGEPGAAVVSTTDFDRVLSLLKEIAG
ncbi:MAG: DUF4340 domain-containing protein [Acidimicrobiia bacterium]|nr:DUF4340 domain-containing protein [Acidimicrobiia bacterium]